MHKIYFPDSLKISKAIIEDVNFCEDRVFPRNYRPPGRNSSETFAEIFLETKRLTTLPTWSHLFWDFRKCLDIEENHFEIEVRTQ